jgi:hypothetical protein
LEELVDRAEGGRVLSAHGEHQLLRAQQLAQLLRRVERAIRPPYEEVARRSRTRGGAERALERRGGLEELAALAEGCKEGGEGRFAQGLIA